MTDAEVVVFDRLDTGEHVTMLSSRGRSVAAIVHPPREGMRVWTLAGDIHDRGARPEGSAVSLWTALGEATLALAHELGVTVGGWTVEA